MSAAPCTWLIESRSRKRSWLPKWVPGNVVHRSLLSTMTEAEARELVEFSYQSGCFAALATNEAGTYITVGGVQVQ